MVILDKISIEYRAIVLPLLGRQLKRLEVHNCEAFNLDELVPCVGLEELEMRYDAGPIKSTVYFTMDKLNHVITQLANLKQLTMSEGLIQPLLEKQQLAVEFETAKIHFTVKNRV